MPELEPLDLGQLRSALQEAEAPWQQAYTTITALTESERVIRLGVPATPGIDDPSQLEISPDDSPGARSNGAAAEDGVGAPAAFDLRNAGGSNYTTPVKNQGGCGSCVAFGVAATMEHVTRFTRGAPSLAIDLSEAHLFYGYARSGGYTCGTGWWPELALASARTSGVTFEDYYPYTAGDQNPTNLNADWPNRKVNVAASRFLSGNVAAMKTAISSYGSVSACLDVYQDFFSYGGGVYRHVTGGYAGGHCVCLVGYDDSSGCWIAKNSWGTGWGEAGYFRIAYGQCRIESYGQPGGTGANEVSGTTIRAWLPNQQILGLWSNEVDANAWAYASARGWLRLGPLSATTNQAMLSELAAAKAGARQVGLFENAGTVEQIYAW